MSHPETDFYSALLIHSNSQKIRLFEKALKSSNVYIRQAAAEELAILMAHGNAISARTARLVRQEAVGWWAQAFDVVGGAPDRGKVLSFLLGHENSAQSFNEARIYTLREYEKQETLFLKDNDAAAVEGHYSVSRARYNEALELFRCFQEDGSWPAQMPEIFHEYPVLINDLGKAFQYTQTGKEGLDLFLQWEKDLTTQTESAPELTGKFDDARYRLQFYAARVARRMGQNTQAVALFEKALVLAPDSEQTDACIWYILDLSLKEANSVFLQRLEQYVPRWHNGAYYNDVMEKYLQQLVTGKEWERVIRAFALINNTGAVVSKSGYAWVIARAIEEGYLNNAQMRLASQAANVETAEVSTYMRIAYNIGIIYGTQTLYYRWLSADALGLPFMEFTEGTDAPASKTKKNENSPALDFLLGFFKNNASDHVMRYVRPLERELAPHELRAVSQALSDIGIYGQSIRLINVYINREGYKRERRDLELLFPRYHTELVEQYANRYNIAPHLFFGLVRQESAFQHAVVSHAGAVGLSQLMPATARDTADRMRRSGDADYTENLEVTNPSVNLHIGTYYLNSLVENFDGNVMLALLAYNGGPNRTRRWRAATNLPADLFMETVSIFETRDYGRKVLSGAKVYEELYYK